MQRKTYAIIDGEKLKKNVEEIRKTYNNYEYYIGVVKNNAYHHGIKCVLDLQKGGINYFAVSSLEEAIQVRKYVETPVLCLEIIDLEYIDDVINNNITITIDSLDYLKKLEKKDLYSELKIHLKIDSGMHRLGFDNKEELNKAISKIEKNNHMILEGIYSHFATSGVMDPYFDSQIEKFLEITSDVDLKKIPIVHFGRSLTLVNHPKLEFCNGIRLGIVLYGFSQSMQDKKGIKGTIRKLKRKLKQKKYHCSETTLENNLKVNPAFSLYSTVMSKRKVEKNDVIGYNTYVVKKSGYILTIPIGYADGVTKEFGFVSIKKEKYKIISDCMDMILVFSEKDIPIGETVELIGENIPLKEVTRRTNKNAYHLLNDIQNRVVRVHKNKEEKEEIYY